MSKELELIEETAETQGYITNPETVRDVLNQFLNMTFDELTGGDRSLAYIIEDIARAYELDKDKLTDIKMSDLLILIGYEPGLDYFAIKEDERWFYDNNPNPRFFAAAHCLYLGNLIGRCRKKNPLLERLCRIDYGTFMKYLRDVSEHAEKTDRAIRNMDWDLCALYAYSYDYIEDYCGFDEDEEEVLSLGDVMSSLYNSASRPWRCEMMPLGAYIARTTGAYKLIRDIFMTGIRMNLVSTQRSALWNLVGLYGENGSRDREKYEAIKFEHCYE